MRTEELLERSDLKYHEDAGCCVLVQREFVVLAAGRVVINNDFRCLH